MENNPVVTVILGGKMWPLKLGHKALQQFSAMAKIPMSRLGEALDRYDLLTALLYCMIWVQDHTVTRSQLDDWLEDANILEIFDAVGQAAAAAFPQTDDQDDGEENPPEAAGTGARA